MENLMTRTRKTQDAVVMRGCPQPPAHAPTADMGVLAVRARYVNSCTAACEFSANLNVLVVFTRCSALMPWNVLLVQRRVRILSLGDAA